MNEAPFVPFYTSDFLAGTGGMTAATKGVYITLICLIYETEGPVSQPWDALARRCGCTLPAFKRAVQSLVDEGKITVNGREIWSEKCARHIALRCERRSSAKGAADERWKKHKQKQAEANAVALLAQCQPEPEPEPYKLLPLAREREEPSETFFEKVLLATGINPNDIPSVYWMPPQAAIEVSRWLEIAPGALTEDLILEHIAACRARHKGAPPDGPRAYERGLRRLAASLTAPKLTPLPGGYDQSGHGKPRYTPETYQAELEARRERLRQFSQEL